MEASLTLLLVVLFVENVCCLAVHKCCNVSQVYYEHRMQCDEGLFDVEALANVVPLDQFLTFETGALEASHCKNGSLRQR